MVNEHSDRNTCHESADGTDFMSVSHGGGPGGKSRETLYGGRAGCKRERLFLLPEREFGAGVWEMDDLERRTDFNASGLRAGGHRAADG